MILKYLITGCVFAWGMSVLLFVVLIFKVTLEDKKLHKARLNAPANSYGLTKEDMDFLIELQHEMLTQDTVCQAAPRFWVVAGTQRVFRGNEYSCDGEVLIHDSEEVADGLKDAIEYFKEHFYEEFESENITIGPSECLSNCYRVIKIDSTVDKESEDYVEGEEILFEQDCICNIDELLEALKDVDLIDDNGLFDCASYSNEHYCYPNTMFLTNRSCKKHIELNHYHYSSDAHSYAMTAWRSPEVEHLWEILDKIDWKAMKEVAYGISTDAEGTSGETDATESIESGGSIE